MFSMMTPTDTNRSPTIEHARHELQEGIESSREMVRQARTLFEFAECDASPAVNDNDSKFSD